MVRYQLSKLLQLLAAREIATRMGKKPKVVLNIINPGLAKTKLTRNARGFLKWQMIIMKALMARSAEGGSRMLVHAVTDAGPELHGLYFSNCDIKRSATHLC
jgi:NAD(P)-dependent dehydrogenase (short-subunit alcohol dehydrogenase family)